MADGPCKDDVDLAIFGCKKVLVMSVNSGYIYFDYIYVIIFSVLVVSVADGPSKQELVDYQIPINSLQPFHQYHLELVKASRSVSDHRVEVLILDPGPESLLV